MTSRLVSLVIDADGVIVEVTPSEAVSAHAAWTRLIGQRWTDTIAPDSRDKAKELALLIDEVLPVTAGREKATAITKCEEAMMWACAGICRHPEPQNLGSDCTR